MNYMGQVAKMLGVELGEEFSIDFRNGQISKEIYYFMKGGLFRGDDPNLYYQERILNFLLNGKYTIKKKPWKPNCGDYYFAVFPNGTIRELKMVGDHVDIAFYKTGNCYRTKEEAEAHAEEWKVFF